MLGFVHTEFVHLVLLNTSDSVCELKCVELMRDQDRCHRGFSAHYDGSALEVLLSFFYAFFCLPR